MSYILFLNYIEKNTGETKMCKILNELRGKTPNDVLNKYYGELTVPIDVVRIAQNLGIELIGVDFTTLENTVLLKNIVKEKGNILGAVYIKGEEIKVAYSTVFYNDGYRYISSRDMAKKLKKRQRFTIAHEIAHCCLNHMPDGDNSHIEYRIDQLATNNQREIDANIFAGELLIPTVIITDLIKMCGNTPPVQILADLFYVSKSVMKARLEYLIETGKLSSSIVLN